MPVVWLTEPAKAPAQTGAFSVSDHDLLSHAIIRPNRSLPRKGFHWLLLILWGFLLIPLIPLLGSYALWVMLPFLLGAVVALGYSIERNYRDGELFEELTLTHKLLKVVRHTPRRMRQEWQANPYWVRLNILKEGGPVENYLTLKGGKREIELGAFLSPEERVRLCHDLERALARARMPGN